MIYNAINKWLNENDYKQRLDEIENNWFFLESKYIINRFSYKKQEMKFWLNKLLGHPSTKSRMHVYIFYKISPFLNRSLLKYLLELKYGQGKIKYLINKLLMKKN